VIEAIGIGLAQAGHLAQSRGKVIVPDARQHDPFCTVTVRGLDRF